MKTILTLFAICIANFIYSQQSYTITATDHQFSPDSLYLNVGDTVVLNSIGYHSITELDSIDWVNNTATSNGGFWVGFGAPISTDTFIVNNAGTHYYNCNPHASMGMKGVIFASTLTGISNQINNNLFSIIPIGRSALLLKFKIADKFEIYNLSGQIIFEKSLNKSKFSKAIELNIVAGIYIGVFKSNGVAIYSQKVMIN
jgi:plastocyanin